MRDQQFYKESILPKKNGASGSWAVALLCLPIALQTGYEEPSRGSSMCLSSLQE